MPQGEEAAVDRSGVRPDDVQAGRVARSFGERLSLLSARSGRRFLVLLSVVTVVDAFVLLTLHAHGPPLPIAAEALADAIAVVAATGSLVWLYVIRPFQTQLREAVGALEGREGALEEERRRLELGARLRRAFEMADTEERAIDVVRRSLDVLTRGHPTELLLADASQAHFRRAAATSGAPEPFGCPVDSPSACPAARQGHAKEFPDCAALDACPWLLERRGRSSCAAVCVPLSIAGRTVGVLHARTPRDIADAPELVPVLSTLASRAGDRLGYLRALADSQLAAATDALTGLPNRRRIERVVHRLRAEGRSYLVAMGDIDHFKRLNDAHGHETGDRALRVFAEAMRENVREGDVVGRLGGEEFVVILPDTDAPEAVAVLERLREALPAALDRGGVPRFTVSFGVADCPFVDDYADLLRAADAALYAAKSEGRDRVVVGGEVPAAAVRPVRRGSAADRAPAPASAGTLPAPPEPPTSPSLPA